ncbi:MAG: hypothetical protein FWD33_01475 [Alphaproteobacteria bacterium]|nr:hypothetical protein [Alphaproteobacteria bacterium]
MKKLVIVIPALLLAGCFGYSNTYTVNKDGVKECSFHIYKTGNALIGYSEGSWAAPDRAEQDCKDWIAGKKTF